MNTVKMQQAVDETRKMTASLMNLLMTDDQDEAMAVLENRHASLQVAMAAIGKTEPLIQEAMALLANLHSAESFLMDLEGSIIELERRLKQVVGRFLPRGPAVWAVGLCSWLLFGLLTKL